MPDFVNHILLVITLIASAGLLYLIYSKEVKRVSSRLFMLTLGLVIGYLLSHSIHFMLVQSGDVTILDKSCQSFLMMILIFLTFFSYYYPNEEKMNLGLKLGLLIPSAVLIVALWRGDLVEESHSHHMMFEASYSEYYYLFLVWYLILLVVNSLILIQKIKSTEQINLKRQLQFIFIGLIVTNFTAFIFGLYLPWHLGFYYLVEISPLAFLIGVVFFTAIGLTKFDLFPSTLEKFNTFSVTKKVIFSALVIVPITILMILLPLGKLVLEINSPGQWAGFFVLSLFGGVLVSTIMAVVIVKVIANPLIKIREKTLEIQQGNYGLKVNIDSKDEIGALASTFNEMSMQLKEDIIRLNQKEEKIGRLLNAFDKSEASIAIVDPTGKVIEANVMFCRFVGKAKNETVGEFIKDLQFTGELEDEYKSIENALLTKSSYENSVDVIFGGQKRTLLISVTPYSFEENATAGYLFIEVDITQIQKLKLKLAESEKLAALGKMAAILAHEIKTPLTSIKMNSDLLYEDLEIGDREEESFKIIKKEIDRLNNLAKEVLTFSKNMVLSSESIDIFEIVSDIKRNLNPIMKEKQIKFINEVSPIAIYADKDKLYQVFLNLANNAIDAIGDNGEIKFSSEIAGKIFRLKISDTGKGINQAEIENLFEPFHTTKSSGTGLGLAISKRIIEAHRGEIKLVESKKGNTEFLITLPV